MKRAVILTLVLFLFTGLAFAQIAEDLQAKLNNANAGDKFPILVTFQEKFNVADLVSKCRLTDRKARHAHVVGLLKDKAARTHEWLKKLQARRKGEISRLRSFWLVNMVSANASAAVIREIATRPRVEKILLDEERKMIDYTVSNTNEPWGLGKIGSPILNSVGIDGSGVLVAVVDTGVNYNHEELAGRVILGADTHNSKEFPYEDLDPLDDNGHGSHCAGTVAGTNYGVAPQANILAVKVLGRFGSGSLGNVAGGVQYAAEYNNGEVDVISMSLGSTSHNQEMEDAVTNALALGMRFAIAAGNSGPGEDTVGCPGGMEAIISVGATDSNDVIASFSSRGDSDAEVIKPDIAAPGVNVLSCWKGASDATNTISGTSMATPHVAGLMALAVQMVPTLTQSQMKWAIEQTAVELGDPGKDIAYGHGRINADDLYEALLELINSSVVAQGSSTKTITYNVVNGEIVGDGSGGAQEKNDFPSWYTANVTIKIKFNTPGGNFSGTLTMCQSDGSRQALNFNNVAAGTTHTLGTVQLKGQLNRWTEFTGTCTVDGAGSAEVTSEY